MEDGESTPLQGRTWDGRNRDGSKGKARKERQGKERKKGKARKGRQGKAVGGLS